MTRHARSLVSLAFALLLGGCAIESLNAPAEGSGVISRTLISAVVQVPTAAPGAEVSVRFINAAPNFFAVNTCRRRVERLDDGVWVMLPEELRLCDSALTAIASLSELTLTADVPLDVTPGEYRFRFSMAPPTGVAVDIATPAFRVE